MGVLSWRAGKSGWHRILCYGLDLNKMENEQVCNKNKKQIKGCGMDWNRGLGNWKAHVSLLLKIGKLRPREELRASGVEPNN